MSEDFFHKSAFFMIQRHIFSTLKNKPFASYICAQMDKIYDIIWDIKKKIVMPTA